ncbi:MAG: hypothetical protein KDE56_22735 [Anaerolineales bacterium]|nr:hypothetical protein [Anaerolineales bacterium]
MSQKSLLFVVVLTAVVAITACESEPDVDQNIIHTSFDLTCNNIGLTKAQSYQPNDGSINRIIIMSDSTIGEQYDEYFQQHPSNMPEAWFPQIVDGTFVYTDVELALCIHRTATEPVDIPCDFEDGYTIKVHNATYEMTLRDPNTAEIIAQQTVTNEGNCPTMFSIFTEGQKEQDQFAAVGDAQIQAFIEPYVVTH